MKLASEQCNALSQAGIPQWNFGPSNPCDSGNGRLFFTSQGDQITSITLSCHDNKPVKILSALEKIPSLQRLVLSDCNLSEDNPDYFEDAKNLFYVGFTNVSMTPPLPSQLFTKGREVDFSVSNPAVNLKSLSFRSESPACLHDKGPEAFSCADLLKCGSIYCTDMYEPPYQVTHDSSSSHSSSIQDDKTEHPSSTSSHSDSHTTSVVTDTTHHTSSKSSDTIGHTSSTDSVSHPTSSVTDSRKSTSTAEKSLSRSSSSVSDVSSVASTSSTAISSANDPSKASSSSSGSGPTSHVKPSVAESEHNAASKKDIQLVLYGVIGALLTVVCIPGLV